MARFSTWTRTPATAGPLSCAAERLTSSFEFPSTSAVRSTRDGRYDWYATSKNTVQMPDEEADRVELPDRQRVERVGDRDRGEEHRPPEVAEDRIGRRGSRSTQTPAGSEMSRKGANSIT